MNIFELSIILLFTLIGYFVIKQKFFTKYFLDNPDDKRKKHKSPVPKLGIIFFIPILIILGFIDTSFKFNNSLIFFSIILIIFGLLDDTISIRWVGRIFFEFILISSFILINEEFMITHLNINNLFLEDFVRFNSPYFHLIFTSFCFVALINALNFYDGINNNLSNFLIILFLFFYLKTSNILCLLIIFNLVIFSSLNFKNLVFLGSASIYFLTFIIFNFAIFYHNTFEIGADEIFIMLLYPGLDMIRLFFFRIINKQSPFQADRNHLHHILSQKFSYGNVLIINIIPLLVSLLIIHFESISNLYALVFIILYYIAVLNYKK